MKPTQPLALRPRVNPSFTSSGWVAYLFLVRITYRISIESGIVERVNRAASKKQNSISDIKQK
jgi:hypothetical protein